MSSIKHLVLAAPVAAILVTTGLTTPAQAGSDASKTMTDRQFATAAAKIVRVSQAKARREGGFSTRGARSELTGGSRVNFAEQWAQIWLINDEPDARWWRFGSTTIYRPSGYYYFEACAESTPPPGVDFVAEEWPAVEPTPEPITLNQFGVAAKGSGRSYRYVKGSAEIHSPKGKKVYRFLAKSRYTGEMRVYRFSVTTRKGIAVAATQHRLYNSQRITYGTPELPWPVTATNTVEASAMPTDCQGQSY